MSPPVVPMVPQAPPAQRQKRTVPAAKDLSLRAEHLPGKKSLRVIGLGGLLCTISVDMAATVAEAQKAIAKSARIPAREQHLMYNDRRLSMNEILCDVLGKDDEVTLLRCDAKAMAIESAMRTGSLALQRARRLMQRVRDA